MPPGKTAVAVELDLVKPFPTFWQLVDQPRIHRFDEVDLCFWQCTESFCIHQKAAKFWLYIPEERKESICHDQSQMSSIRKWTKRASCSGEALLNAIRLAVREEIREALSQGNFSFDDRLLNTEEASKGAAGFAGLALPQLPQITVHTGSGRKRYAFPIEGSRRGFGGISPSSFAEMVSRMRSHFHRQQRVCPLSSAQAPCSKRFSVLFREVHVDRRS
jgi:hypothetical protein